jgi:prepilin-type N-terminal cleavage/methylation domain-containing protein
MTAAAWHLLTCLRPVFSTAHRLRLRPARGFTLIELMVVVMIISILAVIAVPSVVERMRERRSAEAAQRIAALYRSARLRAMGRGAAVLVRYNAGSFSVLEATQGNVGVAAGCETLPLNSCTATSWLDVTAFDLPRRGEYEGVTVSARDASDSSTATTQLDVCYTPLGRAFTRLVPANPFDPMTGVASFAVGRSGGLSRTVAVLPNGVARLAL